MTSQDKCSWKKCKQPSDLIYWDVGLCWKHWVLACDKTASRESKKTSEYIYDRITTTAQGVMRRAKKEKKND